MSDNAAKSAIKIAQFLNCEGFSDYTANEVVKYYRKNCRKKGKHEERISRTRKAFGELVNTKLTEGDKIILAKFIKIMQKAAFDTGLKIGLTTRLFNVEETE